MKILIAPLEYCKRENSNRMSICSNGSLYVEITCYQFYVERANLREHNEIFDERTHTRAHTRARID